MLRIANTFDLQQIILDPCTWLIFHFQIQVLINKAQLYLFQTTRFLSANAAPFRLPPLTPANNSNVSFPPPPSPNFIKPMLLAQKFIWDRNMVYALIEEYKKRVSEFENPSYKKRRLWSKIAHAMRVRGFKMMTDEMCDIKWRNLKKTFKEIYFGKRSTVKWEYYNVLKHIFEKDMSFYSNFGAAHRRPLLSKKTLNKKTLAEEMELEPDSSNSYIIEDSREGLEEDFMNTVEFQKLNIPCNSTCELRTCTQLLVPVITIQGHFDFQAETLKGKVSDKKNFLGTSSLELECMKGYKVCLHYGISASSSAADKPHVVTPFLYPVGDWSADLKTPASPSHLLLTLSSTASPPNVLLQCNVLIAEPGSCETHLWSLRGGGFGADSWPISTFNLASVFDPMWKGSVRRDTGRRVGFDGPIECVVEPTADGVSTIGSRKQYVNKTCDIARNLAALHVEATCYDITLQSCACATTLLPPRLEIPLSPLLHDISSFSRLENIVEACCCDLVRGGHSKFSYRTERLNALAVLSMEKNFLNCHPEMKEKIIEQRRMNCSNVAVRRLEVLRRILHRPQCLQLHLTSARTDQTSVPAEQTQEFLQHLRWMLQKDVLGQDIFLLGRPGPLRRRLAMQYLELTNRELEFVSLSRDTTESDLKQRREIKSGTAIYFDQSAVRAAIHGRVLVLEGIEKAERNVLPVLNNLLENREMHLEDGRFLIPASRYDKLLKEHSLEELEKWQLVRVSEDFRVVALGIPVPRYLGNPLDPPLRSRFQARDVGIINYKISPVGSSLEAWESFHEPLPLCFLLLPPPHIYTNGNVQSTALGTPPATSQASILRAHHEPLPTAT
uniref:ATPase dynein-related AAA domain-containing protein n=1 Tax=Timema douglasi TaxID=61478 RepID=A0A7R8Z8H4_TIMDO|nr:unnamed protein product [Timema douglasi]